MMKKLLGLVIGLLVCSGSAFGFDIKGDLDVTGTGTFGSDVGVTGNVTVTGTVDGKDIATNAAMLNEAETITGNWVNTTYPWAVNEGGTGASTESGARTALGLGSAATRAAEDTLTNGDNLPDGAAIKVYGDANWKGHCIEVDSYAELYAAKDTVGCVLVTGDITLEASFTISANTVLQFVPEAVITTGSYILTIEGTIEAGPYQTFSGAGVRLYSSATVTAKNQFAYANWWGMKAVSGTNNGPLLQYAINACNNPNYAAGHIPIAIAAGTYWFDTGVTLQYISGAEIYGAGVGVWTTRFLVNSGITLFTLEDSSACVLRDMHISTASGNIVNNSIGIYIHRKSVEAGCSTNENRIIRMYFSFLNYGVWFYKGLNAGGNHSYYCAITDCRFSHCGAATSATRSGGAIYVSEYAGETEKSHCELTISGCVLLNNLGYSYAAIYLLGADTVKIRNCAILGYTAGFDGYGVWFDGGGTASNGSSHQITNSYIETGYYAGVRINGDGDTGDYGGDFGVGLISTSYISCLGTGFDGANYIGLLFDSARSGLNLTDIQFGGIVNMLHDTSGRLRVGYPSAQAETSSPYSGYIGRAYVNCVNTISWGSGTLFKTYGNGANAVLRLSLVNPNTLNGSSAVVYDGSSMTDSKEFINILGGTFTQATDAVKGTALGRFNIISLSNEGNVIVSASKLSTAFGTQTALDVSGVGSLKVEPGSGNVVTITGLTGGVDGQIVHLVKTDLNGTVTINHNGGGTQPLFLNTGANESVTTYGGWTFLNKSGAWWIEVDN